MIILPTSSDKYFYHYNDLQHFTFFTSCLLESIIGSKLKAHGVFSRLFQSHLLQQQIRRAKVHEISGIKRQFRTSRMSRMMLPILPRKSMHSPHAHSEGTPHHKT